MAFQLPSSRTSKFCRRQRKYRIHWYQPQSTLSSWRTRLPLSDNHAAVTKPDLDSLRQIASLCQPNASIEILFSYESQRDAREIASLGITDLDQEHIMRLPSVYEQAGLRVLSVETLPQRGLAAYETTWAKRLAFGRLREVWRLRAVRS